MDNLLHRVREYFPAIVELRRKLHRHPERGLHLPLTRKIVLEALEGLPLEIKLHESTSGIAAVLRGARPGPVILLRGDMDALPILEETELPFSSEHPDFMHACGHDLHTAMLVGAARVLSALREGLAGTVVFMFQPGEEGFFGARRMIEEGILDIAGERPTGAFAMHVNTLFASGEIRHLPGPQMAASDEVEIVVRGRGGHASAPYLSLDPIPAVAEIVMAVETALTRRVNVFQPGVITFGVIAGGTTHNVIPATARLEGTVRALSDDTRAELHALLRRVAANVAAAHGLEAEVDIRLGYPVTVNHPEYTAFVDRIARRTLGNGSVAPLRHPSMGGEDWSYVLRQVPGMMSYLGACPPGETPGRVPGNHSNRVVFDENAMLRGIAMHAAVAIAHGRGEFTAR